MRQKQGKHLFNPLELCSLAKKKPHSRDWEGAEEEILSFVGKTVPLSKKKLWGLRLSGSRGCH